MYIIMALIIIFVFWYIILKKYENFNIIGHEEGLPNEYRFVNYDTLKKPVNKKIIQNDVKLQFPSLIKQRYAYDDQINPQIKYYDLNNFARLKELSIGFDPYIHETQPTKEYHYLAHHVDGFDYANANNVAFNAGPGTSDSYYLVGGGF